MLQFVVCRCIIALNTIINQAKLISCASVCLLADFALPQNFDLQIYQSWLETKQDMQLKWVFAGPQILIVSDLLHFV